MLVTTYILNSGGSQTSSPVFDGVGEDSDGYEREREHLQDDKYLNFICMVFTQLYSYQISAKCTFNYGECTLT